MGNDYSIEFIAEKVQVNQFVLNYIETVIFLPVFSFCAIFIFGVFFWGMARDVATWVSAFSNYLFSK